MKGACKNSGMLPIRILPAILLLASLALPVASAPSPVTAQVPESPPAEPAGEGSLTATEREIAAAIAERRDGAYRLLEELVEINSGTLNPAGVRRVGEVLAERFAALGFEIEWESLPPQMGRGPHLIARRQGGEGAPHVLMIGHLDTVFEPDSPFQVFEREGDVAHGPGVLDMKGGDVAILLAVEGLAAAGVLDGVTVTAFFTGEEEAPGKPLAVSRRSLERAALEADVALGFESGCCREGVDRAVIARRSSIPWRLEVEGPESHSSVIFSGEVGSGAVFEAARILHGFHSELASEEGLTFNVGVLLGGTEVDYDPEAHRGSAFGKTNVVPPRVVAHGGLRALTPEQLAWAKSRMQEIASENLPHTSATLVFEQGYPPMPPTEANRELLATYDRISRDLGLGPVEAFPPAERGAADVSFAAPFADALAGLGPEGEGSHTTEERVVLPTVIESAQRAALFLYRLGTEQGRQTVAVEDPGS